MDQHDAHLKPRAFRNPDSVPGPLAAAAAAELLLAAGDVALVIGGDGVIVDLAVSSAELAADGVADWIGRRFDAVVTIESRPKVAELLADAAARRQMRWRQVTHPTTNGDVPIRYACVATGSGIVALGRDLRNAAALQQRLLQAQQSLERDYLRLRQAEARYRLLFDRAEEPVLIVDADTRRIEDANPAAYRLLGVKPDSLTRQPVVTIAAAADSEALIAHLGGSVATGRLAPVTIRLLGGRSADVSATPFRQDRSTLMLVRLVPVGGVAHERTGDRRLEEVVERMPDAFVLTDRRFAVIAANAAFVELVQAASAEGLAGEPLSGWLGRPGIDLELIGGQLREHGVARNISTIVRGVAGGQEEVEVSAVSVKADDGEVCGFTIRNVARRLRDLPPAERDAPRSVEQLTELVGRVALKDIVRESTDLIERLCIEAALAYTSDNRASAAEILGLSRQSLYSKLHRHGLGKFLPEQE